MESNLEKYLSRRLKKIDGLCLKFVTPSFTGVPDRIVLIGSGRIYFVETKTEIGRLSPRQKIVHKLFQKLGFQVRIIKTKEQINNFINDIQSA